MRHLVELHGGRVEAASAGRDLGAAFTVYLPLLAREARPVTPGTPGESRRAREDAALPRLDRLRALVVDDHEDSRRLVKTVLADCGAEVREADSVDAALDVLASTYIDVLISDIGMPGADGYDLIARVREHEREHGGRIPAVALTAYAGEENRDRALAAGFTAHVTKPVSPAALVRIVAEVVGPICCKWGAPNAPHTPQLFGAPRPSRGAPLEPAVFGSPDIPSPPRRSGRGGVSGVVFLVEVVRAVERLDEIAVARGRVARGVVGRGAAWADTRSSRRCSGCRRTRSSSGRGPSR